MMSYRREGFRMLRLIPFFIFLFPLTVTAQDSTQDARPEASTHEAIFADIDAMMDSAVKTESVTGAVVCIGNAEGVIFEKAYGKKTPSASGGAMTVDTIFDIASLTKVVATAPAVMKLVEEGSVRLDAPLSAYLPETAMKMHNGITVRQLLTHYSGLTSTIHPPSGRKRKRRRVLYGNELLKAIYRAPIEAMPGKEFIYSDLGYILLGKIAEKRSGMRLDRYCAKTIFEPLGMNDTGYCPGKGLLERISFSEEQRRGCYLRGWVQDPIAERLSGITGHAGVFSTARDLSRFARMMLGGGELEGKRVLRKETVEMMISRQSPDGKADVRGLGWDIDSRYSALKGEYFPADSFGHTGYTGTSMWIDPHTKTYVILLTCRKNLEDNLAIRALRTGLSTITGSMFYPDKVKEKGL